MPTPRVLACGCARCGWGCVSIGNSNSNSNSIGIGISNGNSISDSGRLAARVSHGGGVLGGVKGLRSCCARRALRARP